MVTNEKVSGAVVARFIVRLEQEVSEVIANRQPRARLQRLRVILLALPTGPGLLEESLFRAVELLDEPLPPQRGAL